MIHILGLQTFSVFHNYFKSIYIVVYLSQTISVWNDKRGKCLIFHRKRKIFHRRRTAILFAHFVNFSAHLQTKLLLDFEIILFIICTKRFLWRYLFKMHAISDENQKYYQQKQIFLHTMHILGPGDNKWNLWSRTLSRQKQFSHELLCPLVA